MTRTISIKKYLPIGLLTGLFVFIIFYTFFRTKAVSRGVTLEIQGLEDGQTVGDEIVRLSGNAKHASHLLINGREILIDKENNFAEELVLSHGYNIITIEAEDRFAKVTSEVYKVFVKTGETVVATAPESKQE